MEVQGKILTGWWLYLQTMLVKVGLIEGNNYFHLKWHIKWHSNKMACREEGCGGLDVKCQRCRGRGRPKKTWEQSVKCDIRKYGMQRVDPSAYRRVCRALQQVEELLWVKPSNPCKHEKRTL